MVMLKFRTQIVLVYTSSKFGAVYWCNCFAA